MIDMIAEQRGKFIGAREGIAQTDNLADPNWLGRILSEQHQGALVPDSLTDDDIRRGKTFLKFMGLRDVAANLDYYHQACMGGMSEEYDIPLNHFEEDGWQALIPHFLVGCQEEVRKLYIARKVDQQRRRAMSDGELHVRMDAPPGTVNPKKVERLKEIRFWQDFDAKDIGGRLPLHPDNFLMELSESRHLNILDNSVITEQEREKRRAVQGNEALKGRDEWFHGPTPKNWPVDRFSLFNQRQMQREQLGPGQEPTVVDMIHQLGRKVPQGPSIPQNHERQGFRPVAERFAPDAPGMSALNREHQQSIVVHSTQPLQRNGQAFLQSETRAETLVNRNQPSWPNDQAHTPNRMLDRPITGAQPSRPNAQTSASDPRLNPLALMEPDESLDLAINSVLSRYHDHLNEPAKSNRASLGRRRQSLDVEFDEFEEELRNISTRNKHKKKIQFEDDSYDDEEESPRKKKKSPEKKAHKEAGEHGLPHFDSSRSRGVGNRRTFFDDDPTPIQPRQSRNAVPVSPSTEDTHDRPNQTNSRQAGGNSMAHQDDLRPRPTKRTDMRDSGAPQPTKIRITNNKSAIKLVPARDYYSNETIEFGGGSNRETVRNSSSPEPSGDFESEFGYGAPNERGTGQAQLPGHEESRPVIPTPSRAGIRDQIARANGNSQSAQSTSRSGDWVGQQIDVQQPEAFSALKGPPATWRKGGGAVTQKRPSLVPGNTHQMTPIPNRYDAEEQSDFENRETLVAAAPTHLDILQIIKSTTAPQGASRSETPNSASEATSSGQKAGKREMEAEPKDQELYNPQEFRSGKPPKKPKTQRKRESLTEAATRSESSPGSQPAPPKRQSTTPIPLPKIPGMQTRPLLPHLPDIRNPASYTSSGSLPGLSKPRSERSNVNPSTGGTRSMSQEIMSEEQIRRMGPKRAELEIYKNRERAKSAAASSNRSSSTGSSNRSNSSPQSATSKTPEVLFAGKTGAPGIEPSNSQYTRETPVTSQQTHRPSSQSSKSTHGVPRAQCSPGMNSIPGVLQHRSPTISHNSPGPSRLDLPSRMSRERSVNLNNDRTSPHFSPMAPRSIRNTAQMQESLGMPTTTNNKGAATNSGPFAGRTGFSPQMHGIVSPMFNLPGDFGRGHTSNDIQTQDESINKAFDLAKEATFGLRMPDSISGIGGRGTLGGFVHGPAAGPSAHVQQYHQNLSVEIQGRDNQMQKILASKGSISGASTSHGPSQGVSRVSVPGAMSNSAGPQTSDQSPSSIHRNYHRVLNIGPGQPIWSPTRTPDFPQRVEAGQGQGGFLGSPPQFNGFQVPLHQMANRLTDQRQRGSLFLPQMAISVSSPERIQTQPRQQFQGFDAGHHQASPPGQTAISLEGMSVPGPVTSMNAIDPPGNAFLNPSGMLNTQPALMEYSLNQILGPGSEVQRGGDFGPGGHRFQYYGRIQAQGQGQNTLQQGLQGTGSPQAQFTVQGQGLGLGPSMSTQNGETDINMGMDGLDLGPGMGMDVDLSGGVGADVGVEDMAIDPRILEDMNGMDFSSMAWDTTPE